MAGSDSTGGKRNVPSGSFDALRSVTLTTYYTARRSIIRKEQAVSDISAKCPYCQQSGIVVADISDPSHWQVYVRCINCASRGPWYPYEPGDECLGEAVAAAVKNFTERKACNEQNV